MEAAGHEGSATPGEVARHLRAGGFFWLDLEDPSDDARAEFSKSLRLPDGAVDTVVHAAERSSFAVVADSTTVVAPAAVDKPTPGTWLTGNYVSLVLTERFLFSVHVAHCTPLERARHQYHGLDQDDRADGALVLFTILDLLIDSLTSQMLALDDRLGEIQLDMLHGAAPKVHNELVQILGIITESIQELGRYSYELTEVADTGDELPGMGRGAPQLFDRHRQHVARLRENFLDIRRQAKDALNQYSAFVAGRQAHVLNTLTIVATVFLPLTFITGYFGMNFQTLTGHVQNKLWEFIVLGVLLLIVSTALSLLLIRRLARRAGVSPDQL